MIFHEALYGPVAGAWRDVELNLPVADLAGLIPGLTRGGLPNLKAGAVMLEIPACPRDALPPAGIAEGQIDHRLNERPSDNVRDEGLAEQPLRAVVYDHLARNGTAGMVTSDSGHAKFLAKENQAAAVLHLCHTVEDSECRFGQRHLVWATRFHALGEVGFEYNTPTHTAEAGVIRYARVGLGSNLQQLRAFSSVAEFPRRAPDGLLVEGVGFEPT